MCAACRGAPHPAAGPAIPAGVSAPAIVTTALAAPGRPLDRVSRAFFEARLASDLSAVRVHDDALAAESARQLAAEAYTVGTHIVFGAGKYAPAGDAGRALLAHELAHVVQHRDAATAPGIRRKPDAAEADPQDPAAGFMAGAAARSRWPDPSLEDSTSVVQPPISWLKYPPPLSLMTRVQLFDAMRLLRRWIIYHQGSPHVPALNVLLQDMRAYARQVTSQLEYHTLVKYTDEEPDRLRRSYHKLSQAVVQGQPTPFDDLRAFDEVIAVRYPGSTRLSDISAELDRRKQRLPKLAWYDQQTFHAFIENRPADWPPEARNLLRELAWEWIGRRDAGQDHDTIEKQIFAELVSMYEQVLHQIDDAIQKDCYRRRPTDWRSRLAVNLEKAWGDPCKPWFGPESTHGYDELRHFERMLRIYRDDNPFACLFYWMQLYLKQYRLMTDPKAQLAELQRQAVPFIGMGIAGAAARSGAILSEIGEAGIRMPPSVRAAAGWVGRRVGAPVVIGTRLALGDLGGTGADVGGLAERPALVTGSPSAPVTATHGPLTPDLPGPSVPPTPASPQATPAPARPGTPAPAGPVVTKLPPGPVPTTYTAVPKDTGDLPEGTHKVTTTLKPRLAARSDAEILADNLTREIGARPAGHDAHHIVPKGMRDAQEARDILRDADIGINDAANGVWLAGEEQTVNESTAEIHDRIHTARYVRWLTDLLREGAKHGPAGVRRALATVRRVLSEGRAIR
jgi:Domain of unknown function (DUF4157)/A nuclease family of the HNH/ENDO VII superfamily with conserved AHH